MLCSQNLQKQTPKKSKGGWGRCASPRSAFGIQINVTAYVVHSTIRTGSKIYQKRKGRWGIMPFGVVYASSIAMKRQLIRCKKQKSYIYYLFIHFITFINLILLYFSILMIKLLSAVSERGNRVPSTLLLIRN